MDDTSLAVSVLMDMSTPPRETTHAKARSTDASPTKVLRFAGVKRTANDALDVLYDTPEGGRLHVPLLDGDDDDDFRVRRTQTARRLYDPARIDAYCTWSKQVVNISKGDPRWVMFHETNLQKRFNFQNVLQLVTVRYTCTMWAKDGSLCRSCATPKFRTSCTNSRFVHFVMPMLTAKGCDQACTAALKMFDPVLIDKPTDLWTERVPSHTVR